MCTSESEGVILTPPHTCRLKIPSHNSHFDTRSITQTVGESWTNKGTLYDIFWEEGQPKYLGLATGEGSGGGLPMVNRWGNSSLLFYWVPPAAQLFLKLYPSHSYLAFNHPPPPLTASTVRIGSFFRLFAEVTNISSYKNQWKDRLDAKSNIIVLLFDV